MKVVGDYDSMIRDSYNYSEELQRTSPAWDVVRNLYNQNYCGITDCDTKIPKKIHQIWLGSSLPNEYYKLTQTWKEKNPDYEYKLWTDKDVNNVHIEKRDIFNACRNQGMRSDILRYEILRKEGGIYVDTDFECLKPLDDLLYLDFFTGISYDGELQLYIGIIGTTPNHPIIVRCAKDISRSYDGDNAPIVMDITGPYYFTRCFLKTVNRDTRGVVAFPMGFFYPWPNNMRYENNAYDYIKPYSYALHHWAVSWGRKQ